MTCAAGRSASPGGCWGKDKRRLMNWIPYLTDPLFVYQATILLVLLAFLGLLAANLLTLPNTDCGGAAPRRGRIAELEPGDAAADLPPVSILVPARNEAENIE